MGYYLILVTKIIKHFLNICIIFHLLHLFFYSICIMGNSSLLFKNHCLDCCGSLQFLQQMRTQHCCLSLSLSLHAVLYYSVLGGDEKSHVVPAASTTFAIKNLRESSAYKIQVSSMVGNREGSPALVTVRTCESCLPQTVRNSMKPVLSQIL